MCVAGSEITVSMALHFGWEMVNSLRSAICLLAGADAPLGRQGGGPLLVVLERRSVGGLALELSAQRSLGPF